MTNLPNIDSMPVKNTADRMQLILGEELREKLKKQAKKEDLNVSQLVRKIITEYLKQK